MTAVVTDINEYRRNKSRGSDAGGTFEAWSDEMVVARVKLLRFIAMGWDELTDGGNAMVRSAFPDGYDPYNHPGENLDKVLAEAKRRGLDLT